MRRILLFFVLLAILPVANLIAQSSAAQVRSFLEIVDIKTGNEQLWSRLITALRLLTGHPTENFCIQQFRKTFKIPVEGVSPLRSTPGLPIG